MAQQTLQEWDIPGLSLAVVHNDQDVAVAGYGVKQRGTTDPVDRETLFQIASLSKAFTAASIGMLVEKGSIQWEQPIKTYLPEFHLKDPAATDGMTLRDLLSHRTGLPGASKQCWRLWSCTNRSSDELIRRLGHVDPAYPFRAHFSYNNVAYLIASRVAERVSGTSWTKLCEHKSSLLLA
jgi:CubicO group peptidase (beta-lactamase class C family)